jgi:hypothetical protein
VDDDSRAMFDNVADYHAQYPDAVAMLARYCAPRVEDGETLDTIRQRLAMRAGPAPGVEACGTAGVRPPVARGYLDSVSRTHVFGWAWDPARPDEPVEVEVLDNNEVIARVTANRYRADLETACVGGGRHGFEMVIPGGLSPLTRHAIAARTAADGVMLGNAPLVIEPATRFDDGLAHAVASAVAALDVPAEQDRVLDFLAAQMDRVLQQRADAEAQRDSRHAHRLFRRRWGPGADAAAADPNFVGDPGLRALVIDEEMPAADRDAGSQAILSHMRALRALGYAVSFVAAQAFTAGDAAGAGVHRLLPAARLCLGRGSAAAPGAVLRRDLSAPAVQRDEIPRPRAAILSARARALQRGGPASPAPRAPGPDRGAR